MTIAFNLQRYSKDLERKDKPNGVDITKVIKPSLTEMAKEAIKRGLKLVDIINLKIDFDEECEFNEEALEELKSNIHLLIEPKDQKCIFIQENFAWVMQDPQSKIVRYFSRNKETGTYFHLDIVDIYIIITDKDYSKAVTELLNAYNYRTKEEERKRKNKEKYIKNISVIENFFQINDRYPATYKRIDGHLDILAILNKEALRNLQGDVCMFQEDAVFFASTRYIANLVTGDKAVDNKTYYRKLCKIINLLCLLGFIRKLKEKDIPQKMKERGKQISKDKGWRRINYYIINPITPKLLDEAEEMSKELSENGIDLGNLSYSTINQRLGEKTADKVYPNYRKINLPEDKINNRISKVNLEIVEPEDFLLCPPF